MDVNIWMKIRKMRGPDGLNSRAGFDGPRAGLCRPLRYVKYVN